ncbi:MAG: hypothetical protein LIO65_06210, partial [Odoribacter sp.]|nr:hypothetical protein [Odoribacter sp.]
MQTSSAFYYATNAESITVNPMASWLRGYVETSNSITLAADGYDYTGPRSTTFTIQANNLHKSIEVNQVAIPTRGTISLDPRAIYLSEVSPQKDVALTVVPADDNTTWKQLNYLGNTDTDIATWTSVPPTTANNAILTFTQGNKFDNTSFWFLNNLTLQYDSVRVGNLYISAPKDTVWIPASGGTFVQGDITALGGDFSWKVLSSPDWITSTQVNEDNDLVLTASVESNPNFVEREGVIKIAHINEEEYTDDILVKQSKAYVPIDETDYIIVKFWPRRYWDEQNVPTNNFSYNYAAEILNTGIEEIDEKPVGYMMPGNNNPFNDVRYPAEINGDVVIAAQNSNPTGGEYVQTVVFYLSEINNPNKPLYALSNRYIDVDVYGYLYATRNTYYMDVDLGFYRGGRIIQDLNK